MSPVELAALGADDLLAFSRQRGAGLGRTAWNHLATALSGFYRWLDLSGHGGAHLVGAVPSRRRYRLADVPCALSWEQVLRLLGMTGVREPNGRRNYAMLLLIAGYGLRGCEVRALRLNDIDWAHDEIVIFAPKTGRRRVLPLTPPAGEAVPDYLLAERPPSRHREVFLSSRPPHGPLRSKINPWLGRQLDRAGIVTGRRGAHILRHSLAVHLLRSGETLKSIGEGGDAAAGQHAEAERERLAARVQGGMTELLVAGVQPAAGSGSLAGIQAGAWFSSRVAR